MMNIWCIWKTISSHNQSILIIQMNFSKSKVKQKLSALHIYCILSFEDNIEQKFYSLVLYESNNNF